MAVTSEDLLWTAAAGGEANNTGRVMRLHRRPWGAPELLASQQFNPYSVTIGSRGIYWANYGDIVSCGELMALGEDGVPRRIELGQGCEGQVGPALAHDGTVTVVRSLTGEVVVHDLDEATGEVRQRVVIDAQVPTLAATLTAVYLGAWRDGGRYVARLDDGASWLQVAASGLRYPRGLALVGDHLYWLDQNYWGRAPELYRTSLSRNTGPELVTELMPGQDVSAPTYAGGALWIIERSGTEEPPEAALLRVDLDDGEVERFPVDYLPDGLVADGDDLVALSRTRVEGSQVIWGSRILAQPLR